MALVADDQGINVDIRSELNEARANAQPGFFAAFPEFEPTLTGSLPAGSLAYAGIADPGHALVSLLAQASANQPGLAAGVAALVQRVKQLGKVDLETELLPSLGDEAAFALQPAASGSGIPYLEFLSSGIDPQRADRALASLQGPIADALNASTGQAPNFSESKVNGVTAHSMQVSPTVNLTYAIADTVLLIATDPAAVKQLVRRRATFADDRLQGGDGRPAELGLTARVLELQRADHAGRAGRPRAGPGVRGIRPRDPQAPGPGPRRPGEPDPAGDRRQAGRRLRGVGGRPSGDQNPTPKD